MTFVPAAISFKPSALETDYRKSRVKMTMLTAQESVKVIDFGSR